MKKLLFILIFILIAATAACKPQAPEISAESFPFPSLKPALTAIPVDIDTCVGEWVGYLGEESKISSIKSTSWSDWAYTVKLNIGENIWLSMDRLEFSNETDDTIGGAYLKPPIENAGMRLSFNGIQGTKLIINLDQFAYHAGKTSLLPEGSLLELEYYRIETEEDMDSDIAFLSPLFRRGYTTKEMLLGNIISPSGEKLFIVRLAKMQEQRSSGIEYYEPYWLGNTAHDSFWKEFVQSMPGIRGVYSFGEVGADNSFSTYIIVYTDNQGYEHIRLLFGEIFEGHRQDGSYAFILNDWRTMNQFGLTVAGTISWRRAISIDVSTGEFVDVSRQHSDFFKQKIPKLEWELATILLDSEYDHRYRAERDQLTALLRHYYEQVEGEQPEDIYSRLPKLEPNSPAIWADLDGDGSSEKIEPCFYGSEGKDSKTYEHVKFRVNSKWIYYPMFCGEGPHEIHIVDIDTGKPGVDLAIEDAENECVYIYRHMLDTYTKQNGWKNEIQDDWEDMVVSLDSIKVLGALPENHGGLSIAMPGDGSICGARRSELIPELLLRVVYIGPTIYGSYEQLGPYGSYYTENVLMYEAVVPIPINLGQNCELYRFPNGELSNSTVLGTQYFIIASDEKEWLKISDLWGRSIYYVKSKSVAVN